MSTVPAIEPRPMRPPMIIGIFIAIALLAHGCGGDSASVEMTTLVTALTASIKERDTRIEKLDQQLKNVTYDVESITKDKLAKADAERVRLGSLLKQKGDDLAAAQRAVVEERKNSAAVIQALVAERVKRSRDWKEIDALAEQNQVLTTSIEQVRAETLKTWKEALDAAKSKPGQ